MYKLLLVDDEPVVRKGMMSLISWDRHGVVVVGEASNGSEALEKALELRPHIIVTDIRMPVMDGIELTYHIREKLPECKLIIMSGYDEFAYAKTLMSLKVTNYLLKPVVEEELSAVLTSLIREIEDENIYKSSRIVVDRLLVENLPQLKSAFMKKILSCGFEDSNEFMRQADVLNIDINLSEHTFNVIVMEIENPNVANTDALESEQLKYSISNIAEEIIRQHASGLICYSGFDHFIGLVCQITDGQQNTETLIQSIQYSVRQHLNTSLNIALGTTVADISEIPCSYKNSLTALEEKKHTGKRNFIKIAIKYMEEHYDSDISLADVAGIAFVTPNYLSKIFKEEMNTNFVEWLNRLRI